ncbi:hypothetical protein BDEG_27847 [Batrachochytrium dendrobatidis JEL423]|uniref:Uncharacterized protein n=1 Tax=Batrachochytrium dendrobatidis (strain JEL423) TaxID=403673 RepID=A0A177WX30_BATDL|nr:hypothetical protein BDEG_27847 [Batrachochytrium dendrobatidis JEL423]
MIRDRLNPLTNLMKLVDILFVLTAAATANAILIPTDNNGSPQASVTSSQVSGPTDEPNTGTSDDWQSIVDAINSDILDENWKYLFDSTDSDQDWQSIVDQPSPSTFNQELDPIDEPNSNILKGWQQSIDLVDPNTPKRAQKQPIDELGPSISEQDWQDIIDKPDPGIPKDWKGLIDAINSKNSKEYWQQPTDEPDPGIPDKYWQRLIDEVDLDTFENWQELFDIADPSTSSQDQQHSMDTIDSSIINEYWQDLFDIADSSTSSQVSGPTNEPNPDISNQTQQQPVNELSLDISDQTQQHPIDVNGPSTFKRGRKRPIVKTSQSTSSQAPGSTNEHSSNTSGKYWKLLFVVINPNIPIKYPISRVGPSTPKRSRKRPINRAGPNALKQGQKQPIEKDGSGNTVTDQVTVLSKQDQKTFDGIKQRVKIFRKIAKEKRQAYYKYKAVRLEQHSALKGGKVIYESMHSLKVETQLKQEYKKAGVKVYNLRQKLKFFMKKYGLKFEEPESDPD